MKTLNLILLFANFLIYSIFWQIVFSKDILLFPDIGQGKSFILKDSRVIFIYDVGKENIKIIRTLQKVMPFYRKDIDILIISHPDTDHYLALNFLEKKYKIRNLLINQTALKDFYFSQLVNQLKNQGTKIVFLKEKDRIIFNDTLIFVLHPDKVYKQDNNNSLVVYGKIKNISFLLTGDIEKIGIEENLIKYLKLLKGVTILDYPHHGSRFSLVHNFFKELNPKIVVIQSGFNKYGHPHKEVLDFFKKENKILWLTNLNGDLILDLGYN
ncbi:ComE operon protein 3 [bacterium HR35]|nr:ComE operon protein 3 [bacterium HR35]